MADQLFIIKSYLGGAELYRANAGSIKAALEKGIAGGAYLQGAYLQGAYLQGANLQGANLQGADLQGANLQGANLRDANLQGAYLQGANLRDANLRGAIGLTPARITPLLMLLDQPKKIRAYKLVNDHGEGPFNGGIKYEIGQNYSVDNANCDVNEHCGAGINVATLDWCLREYQKNRAWKILIVEFTATDIAAIPTATDGKFRLHRCKVVGEKNLEGLV